MILGVDTGGTFTDFVLLTRSSSQPASSSSNNNTGQSAELRTHKVLSTPGSPERAILLGIEEMGLAAEVATGQVKIIHGSTVATNAALEGKGVKTAFITNTGFRDLLTIGRQTRPELYLLETPPIPPPVSRALCLEADGRIDSLGNELVPLNQLNLEALLTTLNQQNPMRWQSLCYFPFSIPAMRSKSPGSLQRILIIRRLSPARMRCCLNTENMNEALPPGLMPHWVPWLRNTC